MDLMKDKKNCPIRCHPLHDNVGATDSQAPEIL